MSKIKKLESPKSLKDQHITNLMNHRFKTIEELRQLGIRAFKNAKEEEIRICNNHMADSTMTDSHIDDDRISNRLKMLDKIDEAITRVWNDEYGYCSNPDDNPECNGTIPIARLETVPFTDTCCACKEIKEKKASIQKNGSTVRWDRAYKRPVYA